MITNFNGELCGHYPSKIILLEYQLTEAERNKDNFNGSVYIFYIYICSTNMQIALYTVSRNQKRQRNFGSIFIRTYIGPLLPI